VESDLGLTAARFDAGLAVLQQRRQIFEIGIGGAVRVQVGVGVRRL
jgi:hypothetical protein